MTGQRRGGPLPGVVPGCGSRPIAVAQGRQLHGETTLPPPSWSSRSSNRPARMASATARAAASRASGRRLRTVCAPPPPVRPIAVQVARYPGATGVAVALPGPAWPVRTDKHRTKPAWQARKRPPTAKRVSPGGSTLGGHHRPQESKSKLRQPDSTTPSLRKNGP